MKTTLLIGPNDHTQFLLNVQPVMPFKLNEDWFTDESTGVPSKETNS